MNYEKFKEYERKAYSTVYSEDEGGFHDDVIKLMATNILPAMNLAPESKIIDIGCGPGLFAECARTLGYHNVTGVTLSNRDYETCQDKGLSVIKSSMTDMALEDSSVDFIWCRHALEHSPYPLFTLYEFHRVLKDTGKMFIEVPKPDNERVFMHEYNPNHYSIMGVRMWEGLFEKSGFEKPESYVYTLDVTFDRVYQEQSYIFLVKKSTRSVAEVFKTNYGIEFYKPS